MRENFAGAESRYVGCESVKAFDVTNVILEIFYMDAKRLQSSKQSTHRVYYATLTNFTKFSFNYFMFTF